MKNNIENFASIGSQELMEINGGGFAFDVGRVLRFIGLALPGDVSSLAHACADWGVRAEKN
jgi:hypothetical protein